MVIYKITNLTNGKIYIGQTITDIHKRLVQHSLNKNTVIGHAIRKYNIENFKIEELQKCDNRQHMNEREIFYIQFFESNINKNGYNIRGLNNNPYTFSDSTKKKISVNTKVAMSKIKNLLYKRLPDKYIKKLHVKQRKSATQISRILFEKFNIKVSRQTIAARLKLLKIFDRTVGYERLCELNRGANNNMFNRSHKKELIQQITEKRTIKLPKQKIIELKSKNKSFREISKILMSECNIKISGSRLAKRYMEGNL